MYATQPSAFPTPSPHQSTRPGTIRTPARIRPAPSRAPTSSSAVLFVSLCLRAFVSKPERGRSPRRGIFHYKPNSQSHLNPGRYQKRGTPRAATQKTRVTVTRSPLRIGFGPIHPIPITVSTPTPHHSIPRPPIRVHRFKNPSPRPLRLRGGNIRRWTSRKKSHAATAAPLGIRAMQEVWGLYRRRRRL